APLEPPAEAAAAEAAPPPALGGDGGAGGAPASAPEAAMAPLPTAAAAGSVAGAPRRTAPEAALRAGEIDDNAAFADYLAYLAGYQFRDVRPADVSERYLISVIDEGQRPVLDARVTVYDGERAIFRGRTYAGGKTIFMPRLLDAANAAEFRVVAEHGQARAETTFARGASERVELGLRGAGQDRALRLDLLFLLDTTGSMGDELGRIQATIDGIAARIDAFTPRPRIRYALVAYRDEGDEYVTRPSDFTDDLATFRDMLRAQTAFGGGDTPEALDEALYDAVVRAGWSDEPAVRLAFLVADAGPHVPGPSQFTYLDGAREAAARGVKIYPIAASNSDPQAEYVMRQLAQQTMAGFVFLTYQPGASGGAPGESTALEAGEQPYTVERLDDLIVGIVERELAAAVGAR
ncbi:MAG TPA: VWA domain-containing protein, partial [Chloroflexaceae bacterium]|nr:VWA domain-containing protein [Chloroflexaceae bacterium]